MQFDSWIRRGIRWLTKPDVLRRMDVAGTIAPRQPAKGCGIPPVYAAAVSAENDGAAAEAACRDYFRRLGSVWPSLVPAGDPSVRDSCRILVKINLNTADAWPASTDPRMLRALLVFLRDNGYRSVRVGDCSAVSAVPTRKVAGRMGILDAAAGLAEFVCFDEEPWLKMETGLPVLPSVTVPQALDRTDFLIHLANMKTHSLADFSFGLKLAVGYMHPLERYALHRGNLQEKAAELAAAVPADLTLVDGRRAFVCGGPVQGRVEAGGTVLAGRNPLAVDVAAYSCLYELKRRCGCVESFGEDPFSMRQLAHAREIGIGGAWEGYETVAI